MNTLKGWRGERGITIRDLALRARVAPRTLVLAESGRQVPRLVTMRRIADALGVAPLEIEEFARAVEDTLGVKLAPSANASGDAGEGAAAIGKPSGPLAGREVPSS